MTRQYRYNISILHREKILTRLIGIRDYRTVNDTLTTAAFRSEDL